MRFNDLSASLWMMRHKELQRQSQMRPSSYNTVFVPDAGFISSTHGCLRASPKRGGMDTVFTTSGIACTELGPGLPTAGLAFTSGFASTGGLATASGFVSTSGSAGKAPYGTDPYSMMGASTLGASTMGGSTLGGSTLGRTSSSSLVLPPGGYPPGVTQTTSMRGSVPGSPVFMNFGRRIDPPRLVTNPAAQLRVCSRTVSEDDTAPPTSRVTVGTSSRVTVDTSNRVIIDPSNRSTSSHGNAQIDNLSDLVDKIGSIIARPRTRDKGEESRSPQRLHRGTTHDISPVNALTSPADNPANSASQADRPKRRTYEEKRRLQENRRNRDRHDTRRLEFTSPKEYTRRPDEQRRHADSGSQATQSKVDTEEQQTESKERAEVSQPQEGEEQPQEGSRRRDEGRGNNKRRLERKTTESASMTKSESFVKSEQLTTSSKSEYKSRRPKKPSIIKAEDEPNESAAAELVKQQGVEKTKRLKRRGRPSTTSVRSESDHGGENLAGIPPIDPDEVIDEIRMKLNERGRKDSNDFGRPRRGSEFRPRSQGPAWAAEDECVCFGPEGEEAERNEVESITYEALNSEEEDESRDDRRLFARPKKFRTPTSMLVRREGEGEIRALKPLPVACQKKPSPTRLRLVAARPAPDSRMNRYKDRRPKRYSRNYEDKPVETEPALEEPALPQTSAAPMRVNTDWRANALRNVIQNTELDESVEDEVAPKKKPVVTRTKLDTHMDRERLRERERTRDRERYRDPQEFTAPAEHAGSLEREAFRRQDRKQREPIASSQTVSAPEPTVAKSKPPEPGPLVTAGAPPPPKKWGPSSKPLDLTEAKGTELGAVRLCQGKPTVGKSRWLFADTISAILSGKRPVSSPSPDPLLDPLAMPALAAVLTAPVDMASREADAAICEKAAAPAEEKALIETKPAGVEIPPTVVETAQAVVETAHAGTTPIAAETTEDGKRKGSHDSPKVSEPKLGEAKVGETRVGETRSGEPSVECAERDGDVKCEDSPKSAPTRGENDLVDVKEDSTAAICESAPVGLPTFKFGGPLKPPSLNLFEGRGKLFTDLDLAASRVTEPPARVTPTVTATEWERPSIDPIEPKQWGDLKRRSDAMRLGDVERNGNMEETKEGSELGKRENADGDFDKDMETAEDITGHGETEIWPIPHRSSLNGHLIWSIEKLLSVRNYPSCTRPLSSSFLSGDDDPRRGIRATSTRNVGRASKWGSSFTDSLWSKHPRDLGLPVRKLASTNWRTAAVKPIAIQTPENAWIIQQQKEKEQG